MNNTVKIGRNALCPCGSGKKYKACCLEKVDWKTMIEAPIQDAARYLRLRGKNLVFLDSILGALQVDRFTPRTSFAELKRAFSPNVVQRIYSSIVDVWPDFDDFERCIKEESGAVTALYTGNYQPEAVFRAVTRLALYCDKIYLVDPFLRPQNIRDDFNPLLHPEEHRGNAIKFSFLWLSLMPWIEAGIVNFVRPLHDFIPGLWHEVLRLEKQRIENNPKLKAILDEEVKTDVGEVGPLDRGMGEWWFLSQPDEAFGSDEEFLRYIRLRRDQHPYYVEMLPGQTSELYHDSTGACYELAKRMCSFTNSHIVTDMRTRWKEIEFDRESAGIDMQGWSPFAKALQESDLKLLNDVPMQAALQLRHEERLESLRLFFRKVWRSCRNPDEFSDENAVNLSAELREEVAKANQEWKKIDQDLLKWVGGAGAAIISSGVVGFVPAASSAAVAGITGLIQAQIRRSTFKERFPAGFFLGLRKK